MSKRINIQKLLQMLLILAIAATVSFAFYQSMLPPDKSEAESDKVGDIVGEIIPPETPVGGFVQINLRKIAHFVEFAIIGTEMAFYIFFFKNTREAWLLSYPAALFVAFLDESIQIFSKRGASIADVWLDFSGFVSLFLITYSLLFGVSRVIRWLKGREKRENG